MVEVEIKKTHNVCPNELQGRGYGIWTVVRDGVVEIFCGCRGRDGRGCGITECKAGVTMGLDMAERGALEKAGI